MRDTLSARRLLAVAGITTLFVLALAAPAAAQTGGTGTPGSTTTTTTTTPTAPIGPPGRAWLRKDGIAVAPADAPPAIQQAIAAGNAIKHLPYRWGGGHRTFFDTGYDCSGAVSYVLHAAGLLKTPMASGDLARSWGSLGLGQWITVYANRSHTYMVVAGLRWDTSAVGESLRSGSGPRWRATARAATGYTSKYYPGL
jgi:hypothetical protein